MAQTLQQVQQQIAYLGTAIRRLQSSICCSTGNGLSFVTTQDTDTVAFSGLGTADDPLTATAMAGGDAGVSSFNSRTGAVTLTSGDVTTALGYTPLNGVPTINQVLTSGNTSVNHSLSLVGTTSNIDLNITGTGTNRAALSVGTSGGGGISIQSTNGIPEVVVTSINQLPFSIMNGDTQIFYSDGRVQGANGINNSDFVTLQQLNARNLQFTTTAGNTSTNSIILNSNASYQTNSTYTTSNPITQYNIGITNTGVGGTGSILFNTIGSNGVSHSYIEVSSLDTGSGPNANMYSGIKFSVNNNGTQVSALQLYASGAGALAEFAGTVSGSPATTSNQFVTLSQLNSVQATIPIIHGGTFLFSGDNISTSFTIPHGFTTVTAQTVTRNTNSGDPNNVAGIQFSSEIQGSNIVVTFVEGPLPAGENIRVNWIAFGV